MSAHIHTKRTPSHTRKSLNFPIQELDKLLAAPGLLGAVDPFTPSKRLRDHKSVVLSEKALKKNIIQDEVC